MDITGKVIIFPEIKQRKDGSKYVACSTSVHAKDENGKDVYKSMRVIFDKQAFPDEKLANLDPNYYYLFEVASAWITCRAYTNKDGVRCTEFALFIGKGKPTDKKEKAVKPASNDNPDLW